MCYTGTMMELELQTQTSAGGFKSAKQMAPTPRRGVVPGRCHICRDLTSVEHLIAVGHWVCLGCQDRFMDRGAEFMRDLCRGESLDCCGPIARLG